ncbi:hypothetical protein [Marinicrinis lubricantis]|uniref:Uncharacterized protein n=1 Tax=Marinicrinis lubricantis TaxID=2086470 RepID=A0ABW1IJG6_9BACL
MKQILIFVLFSALLCWLLFSPIYKHVLIMRQAMIQKEVDYLLEIGTNASHGYISASMLNESKERLERHGFEPSELNYVVSSVSGQPADNAAAPILRGDGIQLTISYPYDGLFMIDKLIGISSSDDGGSMSATGLQMSEYVP